MCCYCVANVLLSVGLYRLYEGDTQGCLWHDPGLGSRNKPELSCFVDGDFASDIDIRGKSVTGYLMSIKGAPKPQVRKIDFGNSDRCKREYRQYRTCVEAGSGVGGGRPIWVASFG